MATRTLFVGDVHGCSYELGKLLDRADPTRVILVGDLFTKGPDPRGVWKLIQAFDAESVLGNGDSKVLDRWRPGKQLPRSALRWLAERPWLANGPGWITVHAGVHPVDWRKTRRRHAQRLRRWAPGPRGWWWDHYQGEHLVVHGHTSRFGLMDRRPLTLGLDTACVKGGRLSGYLLEDDRIVSVAARRSYR